jgi:hypothetical protein
MSKLLAASDLLLTNPSRPNPPSRWSRQQIRAARMAPLLPLLHKRGLQLIQKEAGNFELSAFPGLIVRESYWRWPRRDLEGNAIDFFVQVLKLSFHDAMLQIIEP